MVEKPATFSRDASNSSRNLLLKHGNSPMGSSRDIRNITVVNSRRETHQQQG